MDELEDLHTNRTNICFTTMEAEGEGWFPAKIAEASQLFITDRSPAEPVKLA